MLRAFRGRVAQRCCASCWREDKVPLLSGGDLVHRLPREVGSGTESGRGAPGGAGNLAQAWVSGKEGARQRRVRPAARELVVVVQRVEMGDALMSEVHNRLKSDLTHEPDSGEAIVGVISISNIGRSCKLPRYRIDSLGCC